MIVFVCAVLFYICSAVIEVTGDMTVDAHLTKMGLKMVSMAHTSTGVEFRTDYKEITVKFPKDIIEYATIKNDFYTVTGEIEKKLQLITDNVQKSKVCTDKSVEHLLGLKFCQEIRYTNASQLKDAPYFPFTGPAHYRYYMENVDVPKGYNLTILQDYPNHTILFETAGSKSPRALVVTFARNRCALFAVTPWRNMKFKAYITGRSGNLTSSATLNLDKHLEYNFDHNWLTEYFPQGFKWTNNLRVKGPEHNGELNSLLEYTAGERLDMEASATSSKFKPIVASCESISLIFDVDVTSKKRPVLNFNVKGRAVKGIGKLSTSFVAIYTNPSSREKRKNTLKFNTLLTYASPGITRKYDYTLSVIDQTK
ncbi:apolipophorins-like, partial [Octopus bimaculoides]|uniref:apolipophorins-like n=1 Tax=Octopus bimaculoides TaxID=37653 RepID=UPI00071C989B